MKLWPWRRKRPPEQEPRRADPATLAVLEYTELGIEPEPGTSAAAAVGAHLSTERLRAAMARPVDQETCPHEEVIDVTELGDTRDRGLCQRCSASMLRDDEGEWERP